MWGVGRMVCLYRRAAGPQRAKHQKHSETLRKQKGIMHTVRCSNDVFLILSFALHLLAAITLFKKVFSLRKF